MKILCFGSLNLDFTYSLDHIVHEGETIMADRMTTDCGGKGLNQIAAAAAAGGNTSMAGAIGPEGTILKEKLQLLNIDASHVEILPDSQTGHAIIQKDQEGSNCIIVHGGANRQISQKQIQKTLADFHAGDFLIMQNEINGLNILIQEAADKGMRLFYTPAPMDDEVLQLPLEKIDVLFCNQIEGAALAGVPCDSDPDQIMKQLRKKLPETAVVFTLGAAGAWYLDDSQSYFQPAFPVQAVDTTAAGDTFAGFFIAAQARNLSIADSMRLAAAAAALSVTRPGASSSVPSLQQVQAFLLSQDCPPEEN